MTIAVAERPVAFVKSRPCVDGRIEFTGAMVVEVDTESPIPSIDVVTTMDLILDQFGRSLNMHGEASGAANAEQIIRNRQRMRVLSHDVAPWPSAVKEGIRIAAHEQFVPRYLVTIVAEYIPPVHGGAA